jgi:hypothetical protein
MDSQGEEGKENGQPLNGLGEYATGPNWDYNNLIRRMENGFEKIRFSKSGKKRKCVTRLE